MTTYPDLWALERALDGDPSLAPLHKRSNAFGGGYGTHAPLLAAMVAKAGPGPLLELGCGYFSTPLLRELARATGRRLLSLDTDTEWIVSCAAVSDEWHTVVAVSSWASSLAALASDRWAVAFVDHHPDAARATSVQWLADRADVIVVHDTLNPYFEGLDATLDRFRYRHDYVDLCPVTSAVSNVRPIYP